MIRIIGAGFSGLSLAYHFVKRGYEVTIFEKSDRVGGVIDSYQKNQMLIETAANGFLASAKIEQLFEDISLIPLETRRESRKKFIFRGRMRRWPLTFDETLILLLKLAWAILTGQRNAKANETMQGWAKRVLGEAGDAYLIQPMVNGIFAEKTEKLNAVLVLGSLFFKRPKNRRKGLLSARGGMGEIIQKMKGYLDTKKVRFELGSDTLFQNNYLQHNTFLAVNFLECQMVLHHLKSKNKLTRQTGLSSLSLVRVTLDFQNLTDEIDGFGVLFPNSENFHALGVLANTKIFENRGDYNESWIFSDSTQPDLLQWTDHQFKEKIVLDRKRIFKSEFEIRDMVIHRWPQVIPCYNEGLKTFLDENAELTKTMTGNYLGVLGLTGIHERNAQIVEEFIQKQKRENA